MLRASSHLTPIAPPALNALRLSINVFSFPSLDKISAFPAPQNLLSNTFRPRSLHSSGSSSPFTQLSVKRLPLRMSPNPYPKASFSTESTSGDGREILVQHLLVKEDNLKLLVDLQQRISGDSGTMSQVPEFEEVAFNASLNKVVRCKTKFGWHLLEVLSEREESVLQDIKPEEFHVKIQDPSFSAQLIDVREPEEVAKASLLGFQVLPLQQFGSWGPEITTKLDPQKDTYVMCHHGMRSLQVAKWLQTQGFTRVFNVSGGIHAYAQRVDPTVPTY